MEHKNKKPKRKNLFRRTAGKGIILSDRDMKIMMDMLENPPPPTESLIALFRKPRHSQE